MSNILIQNGSVLTMDEQNTTHSPGWIWVVDDKIQAIGADQPPPDLTTRANRIIDTTHMAVMPGMVNAHTHLSQTFMRGLGDDKSLIEWLKQVAWPIQAAFTAEEMHTASLLGLLENVRCGVTSVNQHHKLPDPTMTDATLQAAQRVGVRFQLARGWVDLGEAGEAPEAIQTEMSRLHRAWHGAENERLQVSFGPLAAWRCSDKTMVCFTDLARSWGIPTHIHVAEAQDEIEMMLARNGLRHIEWLDSLGVLGPDVQLVHSVHVTPAEIETIAETEAIVVHCPTSNMYLASGIAPIPTMIQQGVTVALGTDGPASHNSQDILETLKTAVLLAKVGSGDPTALVPMDALRMVTTGGAKVMGRDDIGQLRPGFKADITIVNLNQLHAMPVHRVESALVYNCNGPDVDTVIVDGQVLLAEGKFTMIDEAAVLEDGRQAAAQLLRRAGVATERED